MKPIFSACSCVVLAGGLAKRLGGRDKALLPVGGGTVLERIDHRLARLFEEAILVTNTPEAHLQWAGLLVRDHFSRRSSLNGLHAGLFAATQPWAFVMACDTPFMEPAVIETVLNARSRRCDVVIPKTELGYEPLCGAYSVRCLPFIENQLRHGQGRIIEFFDRVRVTTIDAAVLRRSDPELRSLFNINTPDDLQQAQQMIESQSP